MAEFATITEVSICSNALLKLGDQPITSLDDPTERARLCKRFYAKVRDAALRVHNWNFAIKRVALVQSATAPAFGFTFAYVLPADYVLLLELSEGDDIVYRIESGMLLTDVPSLSIRYIARVSDTAEFDLLFVEYLEAKLAMEMALPLTGSQSIYNAMRTEAAEKLAAARTRDGQEDGPRVMAWTGLIDVRNAP